ncbi:hypothetical protein [Cupriavidus pinatubonensis]|uniref:hypothetical protein n=1 Tax=Cupriavidus pinatubonensis TaxID=248026 RepID=UPI00112C5FE5|nr:hypothetical protein [Cupriavidus pinatubonensis]TPQ26633.1 hypothetical protein C2U69_34775 [Cupriavidus pinatubonensis]
MKATEVRSTSEIIAAANPPAFGHFKLMREAFGNDKALDERTYETVIAVQFALLGKEVQFKIHAMKLFSLGFSREYVRALVLAGAGATVIMCEAARAVTWTDEAHDEFQAGSGTSAE